MNIRHIDYLPKFYKRWDVLSEEIQMKAQKAVVLFQSNPFHPSLRLHRLKGKLKNHWSISIDRRHRIILTLDGDKAVFYSIGPHSIYEKM